MVGFGGGITLRVYGVLSHVAIFVKRLSFSSVAAGIPKLMGI